MLQCCCQHAVMQDVRCSPHDGPSSHGPTFDTPSGCMGGSAVISSHVRLRQAQCKLWPLEYLLQKKHHHVGTHSRPIYLVLLCLSTKLLCLSTKFLSCILQGSMFPHHTNQKHLFPHVIYQSHCTGPCFVVMQIVHGCASTCHIWQLKHTPAPFASLPRTTMTH